MSTTSTTENARTKGGLRSRRAAGVLASGALLFGASAVVLPQGAGALPPGGAKSKSNGAKVTLSSTSVKPGGRIKVTGTNWKSKGSRVQNGAAVTIKLDDSTILAVFPIKKKRFSGYVTVPKQVKTGKHWFRFLAAEPATSLKKSFKVSK